MAPWQMTATQRLKIDELAHPERSLAERVERHARMIREHLALNDRAITSSLELLASVERRYRGDRWAARGRFSKRAQSARRNLARSAP